MQELAVVQREIDKFLKDSEKEAGPGRSGRITEKGGETAGESKEMQRNGKTKNCRSTVTALDLTKTLGNAEFKGGGRIGDCSPGLLVRSIGRSPAQVRHVHSLVSFQRMCLLTVHELVFRYAHSLAERHNLVHATRQNESGQTCAFDQQSTANSGDIDTSCFSIVFSHVFSKFAAVHD